jgi:hypothetical protein
MRHRPLPLYRVTQRLLKAARRDASVDEELDDLLPALRAEIASVRAARSLLGLWGNCSNADDDAGGTIVAPAIQQAIARLTGVPMRDDCAHAGLQHVYGYLLTNARTEHGSKRARWTEAVVERGFGLPRGVLRPLPSKGTLFTNATWFFGRLAFRDDRQALALLERQSDWVAPRLLRYDVDRIKVYRRVERVGRVQIRTDLAEFTRKPRDPQRAMGLLLYSVADGSAPTARLVTAFPIGAGAGEELKAQPAGDDVPVRPRFQARIDGLGGGDRRGSRSEFEELPAHA